MNQWGAVAGMLTGLVFTASYILVFKGVFFEPLLPNTAEYWLLGISPEGIGFVGMLLNLAVALTVRHFTPDAPPHVQDLVESIRFPQGSSGPSAH